MDWMTEASRLKLKGSESRDGCKYSKDILLKRQADKFQNANNTQKQETSRGQAVCEQK